MDAFDLVGLADGDSVSHWANFVRGEDDATQGTAADQPTFTLRSDSGYPIVEIDSSQWLGVDSIASVAAGTDQPFSLLMVVSPAGGSGVGWAAWNDSSSGTPLLEIYQVSSEEIKLQKRDDSNSLEGTANASYPTDGVVAVIVTCSGTTVNIWINGTQKITDSSVDVGAMSSDVFTIGGLRRSGSFGNGSDISLHQFLVLESELSSSDVGEWGEWLASKWPVSWGE